MPKNRVNGTLANRREQNNASGPDEEEMGERLARRLHQMGPIVVNLPSRTRGRNENTEVTFDGLTEADVATTGGRYRVNMSEGTCTCPDNQHRGGRCRHMEAVDIAREQATSGTMLGNENDAGIQNRSVLNEGINAESSAELHNASLPRVDDNFFYNENPGIFRADMERLQSEPVPFYQANALNGSDITFGVELEFVDGDSNAISAELYDMGICGNRSMGQYHAQRVPGKWALERDGSVTMGNRGGELISPILTDTPETWATIEKVCQVAKRHGAHVNFETGGHVHIGAETALDGKKQRWRRFFKMGAGFENVYKKLSGGEQGSFRGGHYALSTVSRNEMGIRMRIDAEEGDTRGFMDRIASALGRKYQTINYAPLSTKKTIEFRAFNGTLSPGVIQANVMFAAGMVNAAERSRVRGSETLIPTESDKKRGKIINEYRSSMGKNDQAMINVLDTVFSRKEDKEHILSVLSKNMWAAD